MYCEMFGLSALPFNNTPDPRFFYNTPDHEEAIASLIYAAQERKGFVLVTGEVGSGKTLLSRLLLSRLPAGAKSAVITNTRLTGRELLGSICREFGIEFNQADSNAQLCQHLERFLLEQYAKDRLAVVILDEAQNLPMEAFEELRMLGNLEADDAKLLQVLILGQPELQASFREPNMRQLYQRVFRTFHLKTLDRNLTSGYISHRLAVAGREESHSIFDDGAVDAVYEHSQGIPRLINQICDNAMLAAYSDSCSAISAKQIHETVDQMMSLRVEAKTSVPFLLRPASVAGNRKEHGTEIPSESNALREEFQKRFLAMERTMASFAGRLDSTRQVNASITDEIRTEWERTKGDAERSLSCLVGKTETTAAKLEERATRNIQEHQLAGAAMQEESRRALAELREYIDRKEARIADLAADEKATLQTTRQMRQQAAQTLQQATEHAEDTLRLLEEARREAAEKLAEAQREKCTMHEQFQELFDQLHAQSEAYSGRNADLAERQRGEFEESRLAVQALGEQLRQRILGLDDRISQIDQHIKEQVTPLSEERKKWRDEVLSAVETMNQTREQALSQSHEQRQEKEALQQEIRKLLHDTREQAASLFASLRVHNTKVGDQARSAWQKALQKGADEALKLEARVAEAASIAVKAKGEIEPHLKSLRGELSNYTNEAGVVRQEIERRVAEARAQLDHLVQRQRKSLEDTVSDVDQAQNSKLKSWRIQADAILNLLQGEFSKYSNEAGVVRQEIEKSAAEARAQLDQLVQHQRKSLEGSASDLDQAQQSKLQSWRTEADAIATKLLQASSRATDTADQLGRRIEEIMGSWQQGTIECHTQYEQEASRMRDELLGLRTSTQQSIQQFREENAKLITNAEGHIGDLKGQLEEAAQQAKDAVHGVKNLLDATVDSAKRKTDGIREAAEVFAQGLADRLGRAAREARTLVVDAEQAAATLREQRDGALSEMRTGFTQMATRLDNQRADMTTLAEEIRATTRHCVEEIRRTGAEAATTIQVLSQHSRGESRREHDRLAELWRQVETMARDIEQNADKLLTQAQTGTAAMLEHANHILSQAASSAEAIQRSSEATLAEAKSTESAIASAQVQLQETNAQALTALKQATDVQASAHVKTDELLSLVRQVGDQAEAALHLPQEIVQQAGEKAAALSEMSQKISLVIKQLSNAEARATREHLSLESTSAAAKQTLDQLKQHAARVGQLVGIIRQLYGTMDARVERIRERLDTADELCRDVPREIDSIREAFASTGKTSSRRKVASQRTEDFGTQAHTREQQSLTPGSKAKVAPVVPKQIPRPADVAPLPFAKGSLGEIVQRNQKLNAWLREMLGEGEIALEGDNAPANRQNDSVNAPILKSA